MAPVTLPPSFYNSFWSPDYRTGLDVLFRQLEAGCIENKEIAEFIESQARAHHNLSAALLEPPLGSNRASTSSLQHTLLALRGASTARGDVHRSLAMELQEHILLPFNGWRARHEGRVDDAKDAMLGRNGCVGAWEKEVSKLSSLRQTYQNKSRAADESEDDAKFAPSQAASPSPAALDPYTKSPPPKHAQLRRSGTVADRISEKLRAASSIHQRMPSIEGKELPDTPEQSSEADAKEPSSPTPLPRLKAVDPVASIDSPSSPTHEDAFIPPSDPHGQPTMSREMTSPTTAGFDAEQLKDGPVYILLSGLSLPGRSFKDLLIRFDHYLVTHPAPGTALEELSARAVLASRQRSTILGVYEKTFSGEELVQWLSKNVTGFNGEWNRCVDAAGELQRMGHVSRVGVGRGFEPDDETFYTLRINPSDGGVNANVAQIQSNIQSSLKNISLPTNLPAQVSNFSSPLNSGTSSHIPAWAKGYLPASFASDEPAHLRLRREATNANHLYENGVHQTEARRLEMEERIERGLRTWEKWERERLGVIRSVLKHYEEAIGKLPKRLADLQEATALAVETYHPEADLKALIEGSRTGPFRPRPHIYENLENDAPLVNFGIDLRRWSGETAWKSLVNAPNRGKDAVPEVLEALLQAANELGSGLSDDERRKSWIYEVPLEETHLLRNALNNAELSVDDMVTIAKKFNLPIIAGTVKLWLMELNPPVLGWEGWEDAKAVYPSVGADQERDTKSAVRSVLGRLSPSHFFTLHAVTKHWNDLIRSTKSGDEDDNVYRTKLSLSVGRAILRPQYETELTIQDRTPGLFIADLLEHYDDVFPELLEKKKAQADRVMPMPNRKRHALVDQRISRSRLSETDFKPQELLQQQQALQHPTPPKAPADVETGSPMPVTETPGPVPQPVPVPIASQHAQQESESVDASPVPPPAAVDNGVQRRASTGSDDLEEPFIPPVAENVKVLPPTPNPVHAANEPVRPITPGSSGGRVSPGSPSARPPFDEEAIAGSGGSSLKRNTSGEASRLRGPRGARGPRTGHQTRGSVSQLAAQFDNK